MFKTIISSIMLFAAVLSTFANGTVNLGWNAYVDNGVSLLKVYGVPGTNTVFLPGNANAGVVQMLPASATSTSVTNLPSGAWSFVLTAVTTNGLESVNSNEVWTNVYPGAVTGLRVTSTTTP